MLPRQLLALNFALISAALLISSPAVAVSFEAFTCITDNDAGNCAIGTAQLSATVVELDGDALLTITMTGDEAGVIEQIFIESGLVSGISFQGSVGSGTVAFGAGQTGGNLPGGNPVGFSEEFNIAADNPAPLNGIGLHPQDEVSAQAGEFLLSLIGGSFEDLLSDLRIGVHVIGYASGSSEAFITTAVPEPGTFSTLAIGLLGLAIAGRRRTAR